MKGRGLSPTVFIITFIGDVTAMCNDRQTIIALVHRPRIQATRFCINRIYHFFILTSPYLKKKITFTSILFASLMDKIYRMYII